MNVTDPYDLEEYPELVFGIIAPLGIDLDQLTQLLDDELSRVGYQSTDIRLSKFVREIRGLGIALTDRPEKKRITSHMNAGTELRTKTGLGGILSRIAVAAIQNERKLATGSATTPDVRRAYILRSFKHRDEVEDLRGVYGDGLITISAYSPKAIRIRSLTKHLAKSSPEKDTTQHRSDAAELIERDEREEGVELGQNVEGAFPLADLFVDASDRSRLQESLGRFIDCFFGNQFVTPSRDEYGMYQASAVARRSADLSRQVGAALTTSEGEIISVGCNDTPKAGGGLYWEGDQPDGRDFSQTGSDPSVQAKREILAEVLEKLHTANLLTKDAMADGAGTAADKLLADVLKGTQITGLLEFGRVLHAEMAAITDAARLGTPTSGATLYSTTFPCHLCGRLIIASGIKRVVFIEPYPKSKTRELYADSVNVDDLVEADGKVNFQAFVGIAPRRYEQLFNLTGQRKHTDGKAIMWSPSKARPRIRRYQSSYITMESRVAAAIPIWLQENGLSWEK